jgi:hypothetical protein
MTSFLRTLLVLTALLTSGVAQVAAAMGDDACCAEEKDAPCPDCPPGLACSCCCPVRGAVQAEAPEIVPATTRGLAVSVSVTEPTLVASATDIFHPPRA